MAQNISLWGASYSDVPAILLPKTGSGTAQFTDVTDTTAAAEDVASGKYFFTAQGVLTVGTASGGGSGTVVVEDTTDSHGGTIREITAIDISDTTAVASDVASGKYFYTANGTKTQGAMASGTVTAPASITGTSATVSTGTNTLTLSKTVSVTPSVTTAGYVSSGTAGNSSVSLTASVTTKGATTYNTSSSDQTIASGTYLTGTQTIRGVTTSNLTADNIKSGVTVTVGDSADADRVLSVTGTYSGGGGSSKAIYIYKGLASRTANSYGSTNATVTVTKAGTYTISYVAIRGSSSGTMGTNLHIGSTTGTNQQTWNNGTYGQYVTLTNQTISANTAVTIYATSGSNSRTIYVGQLIVEEE